MSSTSHTKVLFLSILKSMMARPVSSRLHTFPNYTYPPLAKCKGKARRVQGCCFRVEQLKTPSSLTSVWQIWSKVIQSGHPSLFAKQSGNIIQHSTAVMLPINNIWFLSTIFLPSDNSGFLTPHLHVISDEDCYGLPVFCISSTKRIAFWWVKVMYTKGSYTTTQPGSGSWNNKADFCNHILSR